MGIFRSVDFLGFNFRSVRRCSRRERSHCGSRVAMPYRRGGAPSCTAYNIYIGTNQNINQKYFIDDVSVDSALKIDDAVLLLLVTSKSQTVLLLVNCLTGCSAQFRNVAFSANSLPVQSTSKRR